jgi:hypothetical protein
MHKVRIAVALVAALLVAGLVSWTAEATTAAGTAGLPETIKKYSLIEKAAAADTASIVRRATPGCAGRTGDFCARC